MTGVEEQPLLLIMCGWPFAGKSTLARAIAARFGLTHIEIDRVHGERGVGSGISDDDWRIAVQRSYRRLHEALARGESVVWDTAAAKRDQRQRIRHAGERHGASVRVIHVATGEADARGRLEANRISGERADVPESDFASIVREFEAPGVDETPLFYRPEVPVDEWIEREIAPLVSAKMKESES